MKKITLLFCLVLFKLPLFSQPVLIDNKATSETRNLYRNLFELAKKQVMFGQQDVFASGVNWKDVDNRADIKETINDYPAVFGWDIGKIEISSKTNFDHVPFSRIPGYVKKAYELGGINTFAWHANNPVDTSEGVRYVKIDSTIKKIFSDPEVLKRYQKGLDALADFALNIKGQKGELIPIIFRPFHENTGNWFWWGASHCTPAEYIKLWRFTVDYLKNEKQVHNFIYAYSPSTFTSNEDFLKWYPGDQYVDILGFDFYDSNKRDPGVFVKESTRMIETIKELSTERNKLYAFTETGLNQIPQADWWIHTLLPMVKNSGLSYVLVWRNGSPTAKFVPLPGEVSEENFKDFYQNGDLLFQKKLATKGMYRNH
jgi:mannan endo-1,4-beta-mannosidase